MPAKAPKGNGTLPFSFSVPTCDWVAPDLNTLPSWKGQKYVGFDTEFEDPTLQELGLGARRGVKVAGYSFAFEDGRKWYIPVRHPEGNVNLDHGMAYLRHEALNFDGELVGANIQTELDVLTYEPTGSVVFPNVKFHRDVLMNDALIWELHYQYNLGAVSQRRGFPGKNEALLKAAVQAYGYDVSTKAWKKHICKLPAKYNGAYGENDAWLPLVIRKHQQADIEAQGLQQVIDLENALIPVFLRMKQRGVKIDLDHLDKVERWARQQENEALDKIKHMSGVRIPNGMTMTARLCIAAFEGVGIVVPMKYSAKTQSYSQSVDKEFLASCPHELAKTLRWARKMGKLYGTFVASIRAHMTNGRIHCTFKQIVGESEGADNDDGDETEGAAFGRTSCVDPNLQQQPSDPEYGDFWRAIYIPEPGSIWGCLDYAAQEPRWTTHHAARLNLPGARAAAAEYCRNPKIDPHALMARITGLPRKYAKIVFLALCYGEGGAKLCKTQLGLPTRWCVRYRDAGTVEYFDTMAEARKARNDYEGEAAYYEVAGVEGQKILDTFNEKAPYVRELAKAAERQAKKIGKINLLGGRGVHFPQKDNGEYDFTYKALNRKIQGDSGMQMKLAILTIDREMPDTYLQLVVHDEVDGSFKDLWEMKRCAKIMREVAGDTYVPYRVDIEAGPNWGTLQLVCGHEQCVHYVNKKLGTYVPKSSDNLVEVEWEAESYYCPDHFRSQYETRNG